MNFGEVLDLYRVRLLEAIEFLDVFLKSRVITYLYHAARLLINAGEETYDTLVTYNHAILAAVSVEAGVKLREKAMEVEKNGLKDRDIEYVTDIRNLLKRIADSIESGEYEESYKAMVNRRRGV